MPLGKRTALAQVCSLLTLFGAASVVAAAAAPEEIPVAEVPSEIAKDLNVSLATAVSDQGFRTVWAAKQQKGDVVTWVVVVDGKAGPPYDAVAWPTLSKDGQHVAYCAKRRGKWVLVLDGKEGRENDKEGDRPVFSPDSQHLAHATVSAGRRVVEWDGKEGPALDKGDYDLALGFSPDSQRLAYSAKIGGKRCMVVDGQQGPAFDEVDVRLFSPDSKHMVYAAKVGGKWQVVVDGQQGPAFDDVKEPTYSPDGRRLGYFAKREKKWMVVVDGSVGAEFDAPNCTGFEPGAVGMAAYLPDRTGWLVFSPDGQHIAHSAGRSTGSEESPENCVAVVDGQEGPAFSYVERAVFSPDSKHLQYRAARQSYEVASVHTSRFGYRSRDVVVPKRWVVVNDGQVGPDFRAVTRPAYGGNGDHWAYVAGGGGTRNVTEIVGKRSRTFTVMDETNRSLTEVADGEKRPASTTRGPMVVARDQQQGPDSLLGAAGMALAAGVQAGGVSLVERVTLSPNGQRLAYVLVEGGKGFAAGLSERARRQVVVDGSRHKEYNALDIGPLVFSADSRHFAYVVRDGKPVSEPRKDDPKADEEKEDKKDKSPGRFVVVLDGQESRFYEGIVPDSLHFTSDKSISYLALAGQRLLRVSQEAP